MRKKELLENVLTEELKRFNQIGDYVNEQFMGLASVNTSLVEQEPPSDEVEVSGEEEEGNPEDAALADLADTEETEGGEDMSLDSEEETTDDVEETMPANDTEELEVTDIVNMTKETGEKTNELGTTIEKQSQNLNSLIDKLDDLESKLDNMDKIMSAVDDLENKFEKYRPQTPVEKLELRYLDSGPFNQSPKHYWEEKGEKLKKQKDKHEYVLDGEEVSNYNDNDIKNSWVYSPDEE